MNTEFSNNSEWSSWANYVLKTLTILNTKVEKTLELRADMVQQLSELKLYLLQEMSNHPNKVELERAVIKIEKVLNDLNQNHVSIENKFTILQDEVITPLRIKITVIAVTVSIVSSLFVTVIFPLIMTAVGG